MVCVLKQDTGVEKMYYITAVLIDKIGTRFILLESPLLLNPRPLIGRDLRKLS